MSHQHENWGSRIGFLLAATGSAVGLGNIWKFPYMTGANGGFAFLIVYLACLLLVAFPVLVAEWYIGRRGQQNPVDSIKTIAIEENQNANISLLGWVAIICPFLVVSYYSVVGGWVLDYIVLTAKNTFAGANAELTSKVFGEVVGSPVQNVVYHTIFMACVIGVLIFGVQKGIERASKIMIPALAVIVVVIMAYNIFATNSFNKALEFLFKPDFSKITGKVALAALSHSFFTISVGLGIMISYGSYLDKSVNLIKTAKTVIIADTVIALCAGLAIFPLVFEHGLEPGAGPGLVFKTLPIAFGNMPAGLIIGLLFFALLFLAALTSAMSLVEPLVELLEEKLKLNRKLATVVAGSSVFLVGILCALSYNSLSDVSFFNGKTFFDLFEFATDKVLIPLAGLISVAFFAWCINRNNVLNELDLHFWKRDSFSFVAKFIAPLAIIAILILGLRV